MASNVALRIGSIRKARAGSWGYREWEQHREHVLALCCWPCCWHAPSYAPRQRSPLKAGRATSLRKPRSKMRRMLQRLPLKRPPPTAWPFRPMGRLRASTGHPLRSMRSPARRRARTASWTAVTLGTATIRVVRPTMQLPLPPRTTCWFLSRLRPMPCATQPILLRETTSSVISSRSTRCRFRAASSWTTTCPGTSRVSRVTRWAASCTTLPWRPAKTAISSLPSARTATMWYLPPSRALRVRATSIS